MTNSLSRPDHGDEPAAWNVVASVRRRWWVVLVVVVVALVVAGVALAQRTPKYDATAEILFTPYTSQDPELAPIRVVRASNDGARDLQTATKILRSSRTPGLVATAVGGGVTAADVDAAVTLEPQGGSNVVAVTASTDDADLSARIATAYARAAVAQRNVEVANQARTIIRSLDGLDNPDLVATRQQLRILRNQGDPTFQVPQDASVPTAASGPGDKEVLLAALIAALVLGSVGAVLLDRGDRRVRDRAQLVTAIPAPVLVGVPQSQKNHQGINMPPAVREAFRTLQIQLDLREGTGCRRILVTSASSGDGKTTAVLNLAFALVSAGHRVIVVDFDLRKPDIGWQLGVQDPISLVTTLATGEPLTAIMRPAPRLPPMRVVQVSSGPGDVAMLPMLTRRMHTLLDEADAIADYVLIDTTPLGEVSDALPIAEHAHDVLLVGRPGATDSRNLETMAGLFERAGIEPTGWIVNGVESSASSYVDDTGTTGRGLRGLLDRGPAAPAGR